MTPEGRVKSDIAKLLLSYKIYPAKMAGTGPDKGLPADAVGWYFMASSNGMGVKGLPDFLGHFKGLLFGIESKALKKSPTGFQQLQINAIRSSGGAVFVVDGPETLSVFQAWLKTVEADR